MPTVVLSTLDSVAALMDGPGSVTDTEVGTSWLTRKIVGPNEKPTSTLSVTGIIHVPERLTATSECFAPVEVEDTWRTRSVTSGSGTRAVTAMSESLDTRVKPMPTARFRQTL